MPGPVLGARDLRNIRLGLGPQGAPHSTLFKSYHNLVQRFLNGVDSAPKEIPDNVWRHFCLSDWGKEVATGIWGAGAGDATEHLTMHSTAPQ